MPSPDPTHFQPSSEGVFLAADEDEYAAALAQGGWGEHAIQLELERLRAFKDGRDIHGLPSTAQIVSNFLFGTPGTEPEPEPTTNEDLSAASMRSRLRRKLGQT